MQGFAGAQPLRIQQISISSRSWRLQCLLLLCFHRHIDIDISTTSFGNFKKPRMDEIIKGLWIGDLISAKNVERLKKNKIYSVLSAMRGRINIRETFIHHQILLDDSEDADILVHLLPSIHFIQAELDKGRGVLVHCHAGISEAYFLSLKTSLNSRTGRSSTIVAAYLMYSRNLDPSSALELIRKARPSIECVLHSFPKFFPLRM